MIPCSPTLLIAALNALGGAEPTQPTQPTQPMQEPTAHELLPTDLLKPADTSADLHLIQRAGWCAHFDHRLGVSSWPFPVLQWREEMLGIAEQYWLLRDVPEAGDFYLQASRTGPGYDHLGLITYVAGRMALVDGENFQCSTMTGRSSGMDRQEGGNCGSHIYIERRTRRLARSLGDRFIRWHEARERRRDARGAT